MEIVLEKVNSAQDVLNNTAQTVKSVSVLVNMFYNQHSNYTYKYIITKCLELNKRS